MSLKILESKLQKTIAIIVGIIAIGSTAFGIEKYFGKQHDITALEEADKNFATIQDVAQVSKTVILNSLENARIRLEARIWALKDRYAQTRDAGLLRIIESLQKDLKELDDRIRDKRNE